MCRVQSLRQWALNNQYKGLVAEGGAKRRPESSTRKGFYQIKGLRKVEPSAGLNPAKPTAKELYQNKGLRKAEPSAGLNRPLARGFTRIRACARLSQVQA